MLVGPVILGDCIVMPVGVTGETVTGILKREDAARVECILAVTVPGIEEEKQAIMESLRVIADMLGARFHSHTVTPGDARSAARVYEILAREDYDRLIIVGVTGSRYLLPVLFMIGLKIWRDKGGKVEVLLLHGIEGEGYDLAPLAGFAAPAFRISSIQYRILDIVYGSGRELSGKNLIEEYGFTRSVYYVLADLERKGLLKVRRGRIIRTFPGEVFYNMYRSWGGNP